MVWIPILAIYLVIGAVIGRVAFVRLLGDSSRFDPDRLIKAWSSEMITAFWTAVGSLPLWPVMLLVFVLIRQTPQERYKKLAKELERDREEIERIAKENGLAIWQFEQELERIDPIEKRLGANYVSGKRKK